MSTKQLDCYSKFELSPFIPIISKINISFFHPINIQPLSVICVNTNNFFSTNRLISSVICGKMANIKSYIETVYIWIFGNNSNWELQLDALFEENPFYFRRSVH